MPQARSFPYRSLGAGLLALALAGLSVRYEMSAPPSEPPPSSSSATQGKRPRDPADGSGPQNRTRRGDATAAADPEHAKSASAVLQRLMAGPFPKLSHDQIERYLAEQNRSSDSLVAAFRLSDQDPAYLKEALERFPNHPQVLTAAVTAEHDPAKRLALLKSLGGAAPGNAMTSYVTAQALLSQGSPKEALQQLQDAAGQRPDYYAREGWQGTEEAYLSAGYSPLEAKYTALYSATSPLQMETRKLSKSLSELAAEAAASSQHGDDAASIRSLQAGIARQSIENGSSLVEQLIGAAVLKQALRDDDSPEAAAELKIVTMRNQAATGSVNYIQEQMKTGTIPEADWLSYADRTKSFGEAAADAWFVAKHPPPATP